MSLLRDMFGGVFTLLPGMFLSPKELFRTRTYRPSPDEIMLEIKFRKNRMKKRVDIGKSNQ